MQSPIILAVISLVAGGLVGFTAQYGVRNGANVINFILVDAIAFFILAMLVTWFTKTPFTLGGKLTIWAIMSGVFASISVFTIIYALQLGGDGSIVFPIQSLQVVVVVILAFVVFKEPVTINKLVGLSLGIGALLVLSK